MIEGKARCGLRYAVKRSGSAVGYCSLSIKCGTRDEGGFPEGIAHFTEHTIFKGTKKRNAYRVISRMEAVGGDLNASTSKEETYFHSSFVSSEYPRAVELLSDIFFHATFPEKELEKEKTVVLEEINYYKDSPSELIFDDFEDLVFAGHPLGKNILGTAASVRRMRREAILEFIGQNYTLDNVVLSSVGKIKTDRLVRLCERHFGGETIPNTPRLRQPFTDYTPQELSVHKKNAQTNVMLGCPAYSIRDDKRVPFLLLNNLLGGQGMNTRLNLGIREKKGLAYTIESNYTSFSDTGLFAIYFGCEEYHREQCMDLVFKELKRLRDESLGTMQLYYAKKQLVGQIALSNEAQLNEMLALGHTALFFEEVDTIEESIREIEAVTASQILEVANEILCPEKFCVLQFKGK